jgi:hypothetical protein
VFNSATRVLCIAAGVILTLAAPFAHDPITTRVTWNDDISRIVEARCVTCHAPDGRAPMSLATYEEARPWARAIKEEVLTRRMPKWHAVRGYGDFSNDPSLSAFEIALVAAWVDGGSPRGTDRDTGQRTREKAESDRRRGLASAEKRLRPERGAQSPSESERGWGPASADKRQLNVSEMIFPCGEHPLPEGTLAAVRPQLDKDQSVGISVRLPDGRRAIVAWIERFDPDFPTTYWLRQPLALPPGSALMTELNDRCSVQVSLTARR